MKLFVKNLTVIDFSFLDADLGIVGNSLVVDVTLDGMLNDNNMVMDFSLVKKTIKKITDDLTDHVLIVPALSKSISVNEIDKKLTVIQKKKNEMVGLYINAPICSFCLLEEEMVNTTAIERFLTTKILPILPKDIHGLSLSLRSESITTPLYHYTHGLKKHDGNCQRIAHGHASQIAIYVDGIRSEQWEKYWVKRWDNAYLASDEDVIDFNSLTDSARLYWHTDLIAMGYSGTQGTFEMMVNKENTEILPCDTTVEKLAEFIKMEMKVLAPYAFIEVHAYEGIDKGAIV